MEASDIFLTILSILGWLWERLLIILAWIGENIFYILIIFGAIQAARTLEKLEERVKELESRIEDLGTKD